MKRLVERMAVLLLTAALLAGCAGGAKETAEKRPASQDAPSSQQSKGPAATGAGKEAPASNNSPGSGSKDATSSSGVTEREIDTAQSVLGMYFDAVVNQDADLLTFFQVGATGKESPKPKGGKFATLDEVKVLKALVKDGLPTVFFEVKVDLGPSPGGAWAPGVNQRWAEVLKTSDGWKIKSMATSPPKL